MESNSKTNNNILVTTIILSYNKHEYLKQALFSVLSQTHENQEIIIINDYPCIQAREELDTLKYVDDRIKVIHNPINMGIAASRNKGIQISTGEYIATLDHDDVWFDKEKMSKQIHALEMNKDLSVIGTQYYDVDKYLGVVAPRYLPLTDKGIRNLINLTMPSLQSTFMFPKKALIKIGGFDERIPMTDDYEILFRALKVGKMQNLPYFTTYYRLHENTSKNRINSIVMRNDALLTIVKSGLHYPHYTKALLRKLAMLPYGLIKPFLPDSFFVTIRNMNNKLLVNRTTI